MWIIVSTILSNRTLFILVKLYFITDNCIHLQAGFVYKITNYQRHEHNQYHKFRGMVLHVHVEVATSLIDRRLIMQQVTLIAINMDVFINVECVLVPGILT